MAEFLVFGVFDFYFPISLSHVCSIFNFGFKHSRHTDRVTQPLRYQTLYSLSKFETFFKTTEFASLQIRNQNSHAPTSLSMVKEDRSDWVAVESVKDSRMEGVVSTAKSAWAYYQLDMTSKVKQELIKSKQPSDFGSVASAVSVRWRAMDSAAKQPFEEQAAADRARYNTESEARDAEITAQQEEQREKLYGEVEAGSRRGASQAAQTASENLAIQRKDNPTKERTYTESQLKERAEKKRIKKEKDAEIAGQQEKVSSEDRNRTLLYHSLSFSIIPLSFSIISLSFSIISL